ncbi:MAG: AI-2E family transporter [Marmoricola sp.]
MSGEARTQPTEEQESHDEEGIPEGATGHGDPAVDEAAEELVEQPYGEPGPALKRTPFHWGFMGGLGAVLAFWLATRVQAVGSVVVLVVVALFLAAGLNPAVEFFTRRGLRRWMALLIVVIGVLGALALFAFALVPVISDQISTITANAPDWLDKLTHNRQIQQLNDKYHVVDKIKDYIASGDLAKRVFGGALNLTLAILGVLGSAFVVIVLTLYFLASLPSIKDALYRLAPASRRDRVQLLGDEILRSVGGYVSGAFFIALCAGLSTMVVLFIIGMGQYAVALAVVVALLDVIPMIGATLGAIIVCAIGFATSGHDGVGRVSFYLVYQQLENYVIYPPVMSRSVAVPGAVTVIAALIGASLLGVIGALLAIPTAAAILLLTREVFIKRQDER